MGNYPDRSGANNPNFGKTSVLKGKKWEDFRSIESIKKHKEKLKKGMHSGCKHTKEVKELYSKQMSARNRINNPSKREDVKQKLRESTLKQIANGDFLNKTDIEQSIENILIANNINYKYQYPFAFWVFDFYLIDYNIFIECDGDYHHANPEFYEVNSLTELQKNNISRGKSKDTYMKNKNECLLRFWGYDINNNIEIVKQQILNKIQENDKVFI